MVGVNFENAPFSTGNRWCRSVMFYRKCNDTLRSAFLRKRQHLREKTSFLRFFGVFLGFEHLCSVEPRKLCEKCCKEQLQGSRKLVQGTRGNILAFGCDKSASLVPDNCKKMEFWPKRAPDNTGIHLCSSVKKRCIVFFQA